jgi:NADH-quinone oxidoreductase subunit I
MPIRDEDILELSPPTMGAKENVYLPAVFLGMGVTLRHMFRSWAGRGTSKTLQYPEETRESLPVLNGGSEPSNYRGVHRLNRDEQGRVRCVACFMCATACPANCIHIVGEEAPWDDREKYPKMFEIDELRCIYCGMCEYACPVDAIELTPEYKFVGLSRQQMIFDKEKLLEVYDQTIDEKPM